ncbi:M20/M25/M40 family metallo-hydrolase [Lysobacter niastensis]|uniref:M20/M25/M40 family metallo-hydrolase n=1 Tax=Lysobacter niastensis TaxID=380629 RepID=A0ABS0B4B1_9GAMM|nr:M20/M25/M40 family metallo-hydrolase [Lysobacter niastensis]MBF6023424.1 M20/M25/M40 family metallo-hydrolase [Lysobacter niastensis]
MMKEVALAIACGIACTAANAGDTLVEQVRQWRSEHEPALVRQLSEFAAIPSVAEDATGLDAMAHRLQAELSQRGFQAQLLQGGPGVPALVYGEFNAPGAKRTVVFYAHYDGQPVNRAEWEADPFAPVLRGAPNPKAPPVDPGNLRPPFNPEWRLFGRAVSDDKSSITAFLAAFDALKALGRAPSVNIKVFWEGEEELGSPHLADLLRRNRSLLTADLWLIGDGPMHQSRRPTLYFGARGMIGVKATVYGPLRPLHSGHYGNWVPNPAYQAAELVMDLRAPDGSIRVPGFDRDVRPLTTAERESIAALPPVEPSLKREFGIAQGEGSDGLTASTMRPALNVVGLQAGGPGRAIPATAEVSLDFRLVPDQTPERVRERVEKRLQDLGWTVLQAEPDEATRSSKSKLVKLDWGPGYPGYRADMTQPASRAVLATAQRAAAGPVAVLPMMGGSVPIYLFTQILDVPVIGLPIANHDNNQHAANENARLQNLWDGIETYSAMLGELNW